tara:strand:- start:277 stop:621 length:345 start_codon:yes stop_codon:yes gene_type:complete
MELVEIKQEVEEFKTKTKSLVRPRWPVVIKQAVISHYKQGISVLELSDQTSIPHQTIATWVYEKTKTAKKSFQQVALSPSVTCSDNIELEYKEGLLIRGLSFSNIQELLREGLL